MANGGFITTYKNKFKRFLRDYGWWYTIRVSMMLVFGTKDPKYDSRWPEKYEKHLNRMNRRNINEKKNRELQPIDCFATLSSEPEVVLVIDALKEPETDACTGHAICEAALKAGGDSQRITVVYRSEPADPNRFFRFLRKNGVPTPERVEFYSDYDRGPDGKMCTRMRIGEKPTFYTAGWNCMCAAFGTDDFAPIYAVLSPETVQLCENEPEYQRMICCGRLTIIK